MPTAGYSGRTLAQKLGLKPGDTLRAIAAPPNYLGLLEPLPAGARILEDADAPTIVHAFVRCDGHLQRIAGTLVAMPATGGSLWISWPKKTSGLFVDLTEAGVRRSCCRPAGWTSRCAASTPIGRH